jgi:inorganic pyrophosphatase
VDLARNEELDFWDAVQRIFASSTLVIDRPQGSLHPRYPAIRYPVDYGFLEGTTGGDGQGIDVFRGSCCEQGIVGICCTIDALKRDAEIKILYGCTDEEIKSVKTLLCGGPMECTILLNPRGRKKSLKPDLQPGTTENNR